jgi:hypothetical protein
LLGLASALALFATAAAPPIASAGATGQPVIASVTPISPTRPSGASQSLVIRGSGFGHQTPYTGDGKDIWVWDRTNPHGAWGAGCSGKGPCDYEEELGRPDRVTLVVAEWTDTVIDIRRFGGRFGGNFTFVGGDEVYVWVWNPATPKGSNDWGPPGYFQLIVNGYPAVPRVSVAVPVLPQSAPNGPQTVTLTVTTPPHASVELEITFPSGRALTHGPFPAGPDGRLVYAFKVPVRDQGLVRVVVVADGHSTSKTFSVPEYMIPLR